MDALPRDVLVSILSSLPIEDVISVAQVSRWMLEASQDDRVWARREQWHSLPNLVAERAVAKAREPQALVRMATAVAVQVAEVWAMGTQVVVQTGLV